MIKSLTLILLLGLAVSCGQGSVGKSKKKTTKITQEQVDALMKNMTFECASFDGKSCPSGVARLFILNLENAEKSSLCTGFLASSNRIVTNDHCVSSQEQCDSTYIGIYDGKSYKTARCKRILAQMRDSLNPAIKSVDFAVLELDKSVDGVLPFKVSSSPLRSNAKLTAWVIDHISLTQGRITELKCEYNGYGPGIFLTNCPTISGNSGSPLVDSDGKIVGLIWGGSSDKDADYENLPLDTRRNLSFTASATVKDYFERFVER